MTTASSVLAARVAGVLTTSTALAAQAGIAAVTLASATTPRIFRGIGAMSHGKSRGRCPLMEYEVIGQTWRSTAPEGGTLVQTVRLRAHVARRDLGAAGEQLAGMLSAALAAIRSQSVDNLTALGDDRVGDVQPGPWGLMREAEMDVEVTFCEADYEVT